MNYIKIIGFLLLLITVTKSYSQNKVDGKSSFFIMNRSSRNVDSCFCDDKTSEFYFLDAAKYINWVLGSFCSRNYVEKLDTTEREDLIEVRKSQNLKKQHLLERFKIIKDGKWLLLEIGESDNKEKKGVRYCNLKGRKALIKKTPFLWPTIIDTNTYINVSLKKKNEKFEINKHVFKCFVVREYLELRGETYEAEIYYDKKLLLPLKVTSKHTLLGSHEGEAIPLESKVIAIQEVEQGYFNNFIKARFERL